MPAPKFVMYEIRKCPKEHSRATDDPPGIIAVREIITDLLPGELLPMGMTILEAPVYTRGERDRLGRVTLTCLR